MPRNNDLPQPLPNPITSCPQLATAGSCTNGRVLQQTSMTDYLATRQRHVEVHFTKPSAHQHNRIQFHDEEFMYGNDTEQLTEEFDGMLRHHPFVGDGLAANNLGMSGTNGFLPSKSPSTMESQRKSFQHAGDKRLTTPHQCQNQSNYISEDQRKLGRMKQAVLQGKIFVTPAWKEAALTENSAQEFKPPTSHKTQSQLHELSGIQQQKIEHNRKIALNRLGKTRTMEQKIGAATPSVGQYKNFG